MRGTVLCSRESSRRLGIEQSCEQGEKRRSKVVLMPFSIVRRSILSDDQTIGSGAYEIKQLSNHHSQPRDADNHSQPYGCPGMPGHLRFNGL